MTATVARPRAEPGGTWDTLRRWAEPHRGGRFPALDGYRAVAAIGVLVYHVSGYAKLTQGDELTARFLNNLGNYGVAVFFLLSGFLLYRPFVNTWFRDRPAPNPFRYLRHRVVRIFPAYWLALGAWFLFGLPQAVNPPGDWYFTLFSLTQSWRAGFGFAGLSVAWTLSIEVSFYLVLPLIAWGIRAIGTTARTVRAKMEAQLLGLGVLYVGSLVYRILVAAPYQLDKQAHPGATQHLWLPNYFDWFALGMLLAVLLCWRDLGRPLPGVVQRLADTGWLCWVGAAAFYLTLMLLRSPAGGGAGGAGTETTGDMLVRFFLNGVAALFLLLPGILGREREDPVNRGLSTLVPVYLGTVSYGIYLWHTLWLDVLKEGHTTPATAYPFGQMLLMVFGLAVASASLSYYLVERPLLRFKDPRPRAPAPAAAAT